MKRVVALPSPPMSYDLSHFNDVYRQIEALDTASLKSGTDIEFKDNRLILVSPNGTKYRIKVSDAGALSTEVV